MVKKIKFTIDQDGEVQVSVEGAEGAECDAMTAPFENVLGRVSVKTRKDAFFASEREEAEENVRS